MIINIFCTCISDRNIHLLTCITGTRNLTRTEKRACLTLGALARTISKTDKEQADRIVEKIESWIHGQDKHSNELIGLFIHFMPVCVYFVVVGHILNKICEHNRLKVLIQYQN